MSLVTYYEELLLPELKKFDQINKEYIKHKSIASKNLIIKTITIFQKNSRSITLEFDKNVNVVIGKTGSGKTVVFSLIKWLILNKKNRFTDELIDKQIESILLSFKINKACYKIEWNTHLSKNERLFGKELRSNVSKKFTFKDFIKEMNKLLGWSEDILGVLVDEIIQFPDVLDIFFLDESFDLNPRFLKKIDLSIDFLDQYRLKWLQKRIQLEILNNFQLNTLKTMELENDVFLTIERRNTELIQLQEFILDLEEDVNREFKNILKDKFFSLLEPFRFSFESEFKKKVHEKPYSSSKYEKIPSLDTSLMSKGQIFVVRCIYPILLKMLLKVKIPFLIDSPIYLDEKTSKTFSEICHNLEVKQVIIFLQKANNFVSSETNIIELPEFRLYEGKHTAKEFLLNFLQKKGFSIEKEKHSVIGSQSVVFDYLAVRNHQTIVIEERQRRVNLDRVYYQIVNYLEGKKAILGFVIFNTDNILSLYIKQEKDKEQFDVVEFDFNIMRDNINELEGILSDYLEGI